MKRGVLNLAVAGLVAACGGDTPATQAPRSLGAGSSPARGQASQAGQRGATIDSAGIQAAVTALKTAHDSWQFSITTYESGTPDFSRTVAGTQSGTADNAVSFT